jgi:predicted secreted protein
MPDLTNQIGGSGIEQFNFEAIMEGRTSIKIAYKRAWEKKGAKLDEFLVNVT